MVEEARARPKEVLLIARVFEVDVSRYVEIRSVDVDHAHPRNLAHLNRVHLREDHQGVQDVGVLAGPMDAEEIVVLSDLVVLAEKQVREALADLAAPRNVDQKDLVAIAEIKDLVVTLALLDQEGAKVMKDV